MAKRLTLKNKKKNKRTLKRITRSRKIGGVEGEVSLTESANQKMKLIKYIEESKKKMNDYLAKVTPILKKIYRLKQPPYQTYIVDGDKLFNEIKNNLLSQIFYIEKDKMTDILDDGYAGHSTKILTTIEIPKLYSSLYDHDSGVENQYNKTTLIGFTNAITTLNDAVSEINASVGRSYKNDENHRKAIERQKQARFDNYYR